jgi:hypothetical protein
MAVDHGARVLCTPWVSNCCIFIQTAALADFQPYEEFPEPLDTQLRISGYTPYPVWLQFWARPPLEGLGNTDAPL